ncbi:MAG: site-2 protease family protein [Oscillospiraceae bacterium]|jgi:Zn-dependent protease
MIIAVIPALVCITFHEVSHGFVAYKLGDSTAKDAGRLTLNPIKHIDVFGLLMMIVLKFGWAKPVPVNMNSFKNPKGGMAITALAGPVSNVLLAAVIFLLYGLLYAPLMHAGAFGVVLAKMLLTTAYLSCALAVFNIIPISPLDGSKVLFSFLPEKAYYALMRYEFLGMIALLIIVWSGAFSGFLVNWTSGLYKWLIGIADWAYALTV